MPRLIPWKFVDYPEKIEEKIIFGMLIVYPLKAEF